MKVLGERMVWIAMGVLVGAGGLLGARDGATIVYPKAKTVDQVDDYHGVKVADPYRLARGHGFGGHSRVGGGGEQADVWISGSDSVSRGDSRSDDEAVELRALHGTGAVWRAVFLSAQ